MSLEDVLNGFAKYSEIDKLSSIKGENTQEITQKRMGYAGFLRATGTVREDVANRMQTNLADKPDVVQESINATKKEVANELTGIVSNEYNAILDNLPEDYLAKFAQDLAGEDKPYFKYEQILATQDADLMKAGLANLYSFKGWKIYLASLDKDVLEKELKSEIKYEKNKFLVENLCDIVESKDDKGNPIQVPKLNLKKTKDYISEALNGLEENDRNKVYINLAKNYFKSQQEA